MHNQDIKLSHAPDAIAASVQGGRRDDESIPIFQEYAVVGASCSLDIQSGQDARTTNLNIWDAPEMILFHFIGDTNHGLGRKHCAPTYSLHMYQYFCELV